MSESISRILSVIRKDLKWAQKNYRLLGFMVFPVFFIVLFSGSARMFTFSIVFINVFVGMFSTAYFIMEEKTKGTLVSLLTSPLRSRELLVAKLVFNLSICSIFSLASIVLSRRFDILFDPVALINIVLFAGTACFLGFLLGIFFKNEQELGVGAPAILLFFSLGDAVSKISSMGDLFPFFPEYHLIQVLKDLDMSWGQVLYHTFFNGLYFCISLFFVGRYADFYFSNHRDSRWSKSLTQLIMVFFAALVLSVSLSSVFYSSKVDGEKMHKKDFVTTHWEGSFRFDTDKHKMKPLFESKARSVYLLEPIEESGAEWTLNVRELDNNEMGSGNRRQVIQKDPLRTILGDTTRMVRDRKFYQFSYIKDEKMVILVERYCGKQMLQFVFEQDIKEHKKLNKNMDVFYQWIEQTYFKCNENG